jgi:tetratricopeptide (TPR) repeat protein
MKLRIVAAVLALGAATAVARTSLEAEASRAAAVRDPAWLPNGALLRVASFGQRLVVADLYWLKFVQYVGETALAKANRWDALHPLADIVTDLDPRFGYAYQVAGSNLAGLAHRYDEAARILEKGMKSVPDRWSLPWTYATNKFLYEEDYATAADYARKAAQVGKRPYLALLAANLSALANTDAEYRTTLAFLDQAIDQAGTDELRATLVERRMRTATWYALAKLEHAIARFERTTGRKPSFLSELLAGYLDQIPPDPSGGEIVYDPSTGTVRSTVWGPRAPLKITAK